MNKEIMEIIQDYMDKTLSEGCWIRKWTIYWKVLFIDDWSVYNKWDIFYSRDNGKKEDRIERGQTYINLWHYDTTALLKYIHIKLNYVRLEDNECFCIHTMMWEGLWQFPNKPLHLYTEEENNNLIDLLNKLWQK